VVDPSDIPAVPEPAVAAPPAKVDPIPRAVDPEACVLVCGSAAAAHLEMPSVDYHVDEAENADAVFASMHGDLLACYRERVAQSPNAHASLVVDVVLAPDGSVRAVDTTGGALFGDRTMRCITRRIQRGTFAPVRGGGTLHIQIPLTFSLRNPGDDST
jgi:hypothetical protein